MKRIQLTLGALVVGLVAFFALNIIASGAKVRVDLTEEKLFTLSEGSKAIVADFDEPVSLDLYFSEDLGREAGSIQAYATRVKEVLREYELASNGSLILEFINPEPFSDAEDAAVQAGLAGIPMNTAGDVLYFGLVGRNTTDDQELVRFFDPSKEAFLEYDLTRLIYTLAHPEKKKVGVLTALPMDGGPPNPMDPRGGGAPWQILAQMRQFFEVEMLDVAIDAVPDDVDVLMVVHPKMLSDATLFAIDQYVLGGGRLLAMVDPHSESDQTGADPSNPLASMQADKSSSLRRLFDAWGIEAVPGKIAADRQYAMPISVGGQGQPERVSAVFYLGLRDEAFDADDPLTSSLKNVVLGMPGILQQTAGSEIDFQPLMQTSTDSMQLDQSSMQFLFGDAVKRLVTDFVPEQKRLTLAARVSGQLATAFPDGRPGPPPAPEEGEEEAEAPADEQTLSASAEPVQMIVVADTDILRDDFWIQEQRLFGQISLGYQKVADNGDFIISALDNLTGSNDLISIRARGVASRPFEKLVELEREAEQQYLAEENALEQKLRDTESKINELQREKDGESSMILTPEQVAEVERFQEERVETRKKLRDVKHNLRKDIEDVILRYKIYNIAAVPLLVGVVGVGIGVTRVRRRRPK